MSETAGMSGAARSIEDMQRSEERLARIVGLSADAIICIDEEQTITLFNEGAERTFLCQAADVIGQKLTRLIPHRYRQAHGGHVARFAGGAPGSRHMADRQAVFGVRANGEEFPADASISKIVVGGEAVYTVVLRDVTDRFQREQERRIESDRLKQAMDAGRVGGFELDQQHDRVRLFGHARSILGIDDAEISTERWFSLIHPDDGPRMAEAIRHAARAGRQVEMECRVRRGDGARRWVRAIAARTGGDEPWPRLFGAIQDVTEQKALQQLLEERVAERTQALEAEIVRRELAQETLVRVQRMEAYGQLTGGIAHDFNNLLTVIGGNLALLEDQIADPRHARILKRATDAVDMGSRLTRRLLSFASRSRLEPQVLNLNDQVVGIIDLLRRTIGESIAIASELAPDLGRVRADASEIENAILNLAINARDAMSCGGQLVIETANVALGADEARQAGIDHLAPGRYVRLSVSDTGTGMGPDVLARAFEPFFTTKEPGQGTGLGLASIYGFARQSYGGVTLESEPGRGTMVSIYLPDLGLSGAAEAVPVSPAKAPAAPSTILVVEDNPDVREVTIDRLEQLGYAVVASASGPEAVALLSGGMKVDLVFSDVMMAGGMSGHDVAGWIGANKPGLRVLLTSGFAGPAAAPEEGLRILSKPYSTAELSEAIAGALDL